MTEQTDPKRAPKTPTRRPWWARRRWRLLWPLGTLLMFAVVALGTALLFEGQRLPAPDWLRAQIAARADQTLGPDRLSFGAIEVVIDRFEPSIHLRDVRLRGPHNTGGLRIEDLALRFSAAGILRGALHPREVLLAGAQLRMRRARDGGFDLSYGDAPVTPEPDGVSQADSLPALLQQLHGVLDHPNNRGLRRVQARDLRIRYEDAQSGAVLIGDGGAITLKRAGQDLDLTVSLAVLGAQDYAASLTFGYEGRIGTPQAELALTVQDLAADDLAHLSPVLSFLQVLEAPVSGALRGQIDAQGALGPLNATLSAGAGALRPTEQVRPVRFQSAKTYFSYDPEAARLDLQELALVSDWGAVRAQGRAYLQQFDGAWPQVLLAQIQILEGALNPAELYPAPVVLDSGSADLRIQLAPFRIDVGQAVVQQNDLTLRGTGRVEALPEGWGVNLRLQTDHVRADQIFALWPAQLKPLTRKWFTTNFLDGRGTDFQLAADLRPKRRPDVTISYAFDQGQVRPLKGMPVIEGAAGYGLLREGRLDMHLETGTAATPEGAVDLAGSRLQMPDVFMRDPLLQIKLRTRGSVGAGLWVLDQKPLELLRKAGRDRDLAQGQVSGEGQIDVRLRRTIRARDVDFRFDVGLRKLRSDTLVPGQVLTAPALRLQASREGLRIEGAGRLGAVPFAGFWEKLYGPQAPPGSRLEAILQVTPKALDAAGLALPNGTLRGQTRADLALTLPAEGPPTFRVQSDLRGMGVSVPAIGWSKGRKTPGTFEISGRLQNGLQIERLRLRAPGLSTDGTVQLTPQGKFASLRLEQLKLGNWLDAPVVLTSRGPGRAPAIDVAGGRLDLRRLDLPEGGRNAGGPLRLALDRVVLTRTIALTNFRARLDTARGLAGSFVAGVNGQGRVQGQLKSGPNGPAIRLQSEDSGRVLRAAGLVRRANGGAMTLDLVPTQAANTYRGRLDVRDVRVTDAPILASVLSAVSVVGLVEQLAGRGLVFSQLEADFQLSPDRVTLASSSAVGPSMGISLDGVYDIARDQMDLQGVLSPIYLLNGIGSIFTRKGEGLFGFNFRLTGDTKQPRVRVNPLSALTPGMFREIFRRPPPKIE